MSFGCINIKNIFVDSSKNVMINVKNVYCTTSTEILYLFDTLNRLIPHPQKKKTFQGAFLGKYKKCSIHKWHKFAQDLSRGGFNYSVVFTNKRSQAKVFTVYLSLAAGYSYLECSNYTLALYTLSAELNQYARYLYTLTLHWPVRN